MLTAHIKDTTNGKNSVKNVKNTDHGSFVNDDK